MAHWDGDATVCAFTYYALPWICTRARLAFDNNTAVANGGAVFASSTAALTLECRAERAGYGAVPGDAATVDAWARAYLVASPESGERLPVHPVHQAGVATTLFTQHSCFATSSARRQTLFRTSGS